MKLYRVVLLGLLISFLSLGTANAGMFDSLVQVAGGGSSGGGMAGLAQFWSGPHPEAACAWH